MARTESKSIQVHPRDEQAQIDLMQKFHWSLLNSQEIKTIDNRLERRGSDIYQVTNTEHYVKLTFSRDLELPNLNEIKRLEQEFFSLPYPTYPRAFSCLGAFGLFALFMSVLAISGGLLGSTSVAGSSAENVAVAIVVVLDFILVAGAYAAYFNLVYRPRKEEADKMIAQTHKREQELLEAVAQYG